MTYEQAVQRQIKIRDMREKGFSEKEICKTFNICRSRIYSILKQNFQEHSYTKIINPLWNTLPKWKREGTSRVRAMVRHRDGNKCRSCGATRGEKKDLDVHHLNGLCGQKSKSYDRIETMDGLITLCHKCHYNHPEHTLQARKLSKQTQLDITH